MFLFVACHVNILVKVTTDAIIILTFDGPCVQNLITNDEESTMSTSIELRHVMFSRRIPSFWNWWV